ncbi:hypothetical protein BGZ88_008992 [Linnemannia elongata]|nr:hypothetical protein BGZ88_008992 [Linnemannia elongata]
MHRATDQGSSSSSTSLSHNLSSEASASTSRNTGGQGSSSNLIDLTLPRPSRIVHPPTLPSQSIEIIDLSSDDDDLGSFYSSRYTSSNHTHNHNSYGSDDEVLFVSETPGTTATPVPAAATGSGSSRHASAGIGGSVFDRRQTESSSSSSSSYPETLLHAYHQGRHPLFRLSQEMPVLTRNREHRLPGHDDRSRRRRSPSITPHPYAPVHGRTTHPSSTTAAASGSGPGSGVLHSQESTSLRAFVSAMRTPTPPPRSRSNMTTALAPGERALMHAFTRFFQRENSLQAREGVFRREAQEIRTFIHRHHHYWGDDAGWDIPYRERSPSVFGELLEHFAAFDGAPPPASEAEVERERKEIETKPVMTRPGFTKVINLETVITCPLCIKEFGHDGDKRPTLWVIVGCGHVVCGACAEEIFISRKAIRGNGTKGRRQSLSRKTKGKGKAKWSPGPTDMETGGEDENLDTTSDGHAPTSPASTITATATAETTDSNVKVTKRVMGNCPGCQRKIKNTSLQQLYL